MLWINSTDLEQWAPRRNCQENLPLLIRKLIRAKSQNIKSIRFPSGDNIHLGGWDGVLESNEETEYFPQGTSVWEFSARKDIRTKVDSDFNKRTKNSLGVKPDNATYITVTPYKWEQKEEWREEKMAEGKWKDIRVYDGVNLEEWIELSPAVGVWLARLIGKYPDANVQSTEDFWEEWSTGPKFNISPELITSGRKEEINLFTERLFNSPSIIEVQSISRDEALAFVIGTMKLSNSGISEDFFSRSIIVDDISTFRKISVNNNKLILIIRFEDEGVVNKAIVDGHHIIIPYGADRTRATVEAIQLPRLEREGFIRALENMGIAKDDANMFSKESSRNLTIFRRQHDFKHSQPEWAKPDNALEIIPAVLVGQWNENYNGDREVISYLAGESYDTYIKKLTKWINTQDSPFYKIGSYWRLASPLDAWTHLGVFLINKHFEDFKFQFLSALKEIHPKFENENYVYGLFSSEDKQPNYSDGVKKGLCQSMILISTYGEDIKLQLTNPQLWADSIIKELLSDLSENLCRSLDNYMPLIAEASPMGFLEKIDLAFTKDTEIILGMFKEYEGLIGPHSFHTGLLWAIESLAWFPKYISNSVKLLGKLAKNDPGGHLSNRPINSLRAIFLPWCPNTYCSVSDRIKVLRKLITDNPAVAWELLVAILPKYHDVGEPTVKTRWRKYESSEIEKVTYKDMWDVHSFAVDSLLLMASFEGEKFAELVKHIDMLSPIDRNKILNAIKNNYKAILPNTIGIWKNLRELLNHHRSCSTADWALKSNELDEIEEVYTLLTPESLIEQKIWLFTEDYPKFPDTVNHHDIDYDEQENLILNKRREAFNEVFDKLGFEGIMAIIEQIPDKRFVGNTAGYILSSEDDLNKIVLYLKNDPNKFTEFTASLIFTKYTENGLKWLNEFYLKLTKSNISNPVISKLFISLPQSRELWNFIAGTNEEIEKGYWENCYPRFYRLPIKDRIYGINKLISKERYHSALEIASHFVKELPTELLTDILIKVATEPSLEKVPLVGYDVELLFDELYKRSDIDIAIMPQLEWLYLPILAGYGVRKTPKFLEEELTTNPEFFIQVLTYIYKPSTEDIDDMQKEDLTDDEVVRRAELSYELLYNWKKVPGTDSDGKIQYIELKEWIEKARKIANEKDRTLACDIEIGKLLAGPPQKLNEWLQDSVCKIIDELNNKNINESFINQIYNKRGGFNKSFVEGGKEERSISELFDQKSKEVAVNYPITSSLLLKISQGYKSEAKNEDNRANITDLDY